MKSWTEKFNAPAELELEPAPMSVAVMFWRVRDAVVPTTRRLSFGASFVRDKRCRQGLPQ